MSDLNYFMTRKKVKVLGRFVKEYRGNYILIWCSWLDIILYVIYPETKIYVKGYGVPKTVERKWNAYFKKNNYTNFIKEERKMKKYEFTREEYEIYCNDHLLEAESEVNYNRFREMVENGELVKCVGCEEWVDLDWTHEYENDSFVCEECKIDGFGL